MEPQFPYNIVVQKLKVYYDNRKTKERALRLHLIIRIRLLQENYAKTTHLPPPFKLEKGKCIISGKDINPESIMHEDHQDQIIESLIKTIQENGIELDLYNSLMEDNEPKFNNEPEVEESYNGNFFDPESSARMKEYSTAQKFRYYEPSNMSTKRTVNGRVNLLIEAMTSGMPLDS